MTFRMPIPFVLEASKMSPRGLTARAAGRWLRGWSQSLIIGRLTFCGQVSPGWCSDHGSKIIRTFLRADIYSVCKLRTRISSRCVQHKNNQITDQKSTPRSTNLHEAGPKLVLNYAAGVPDVSEISNHVLGLNECLARWACFSIFGLLPAIHVSWTDKGRVGFLGPRWSNPKQSSLS